MKNNRDPVRRIVSCTEKAVPEILLSVHATYVGGPVDRERKNQSKEKKFLATRA